MRARHSAKGRLITRPTPIWALLGVTLLLGGLALTAVHLSASSVRSSPTPASGHQSLRDAAVSLARGEGPAAGRPLSCLAVSPLSVRCGVSPSISLNGINAFSWANATGSVGASPSGRVTQMTWDPADGYVLLFGGVSSGGQQSDTWTYSAGKWTNLTAQVTSHPEPRIEGALAFDPSGSQVILFGGASGGSYPTSTWAYHAKTWTNITGSAGTPPSGRINPGFATDSSDHEAVLFGGTPLGPQATDTWTFKNGAWTNVTASAGLAFPPTYGPLASDDPAGHGMLLTGIMAWGTSPTQYHQGTFVFSAGTWQNLTLSVTTTPPRFYDGGVTYLSSINAIVVYSPILINNSGGVTLFSVTWAFSAGNWVNITVTAGNSLDSGILPALAGDPAEPTVIVFGGEHIFYAPPLSNSTWILAMPLKVIASASRNVVDAGMSVTFNGTITGGAAPNAQWSFGDGATSTTVAGSHTYTTAGADTATLSATDIFGRVASASVGVYVNPALAVNATASPTNPAATTEVALVGTVTGGTGPFTYSWTLGDGATSSAASLGHTYGSSGTFTVLLKVTDSLGQSANGTAKVAVQSAPSTSATLTSGTGLGLLVGIILLALIVVVLLVLLMRRPKSPQGPPSPYASSTAPPSAGPPAGAMGGGPPGGGSPP